MVGRSRLTRWTITRRSASGRSLQFAAMFPPNTTGVGNSLPFRRAINRPSAVNRMTVICSGRRRLVSSTFPRRSSSSSSSSTDLTFLAFAICTRGRRSKRSPFVALCAPLSAVTMTILTAALLRRTLMSFIFAFHSAPIGLPSAFTLIRTIILLYSSPRATPLNRHDG